MVALPLAMLGGEIWSAVGAAILPIRAYGLAGLFASICFILGAAQPSAAEVRRVLLSVEGVNVPTGSAIFRYRIDTWGVEFLAICHIPPSWELKSDKFEDPQGFFSGKADVHGTPLRALTDMYLVDVYDYQSATTRDGNSEYPASFAGWVEVGNREQFGDWYGRRVKLRSSNFRLKNARRCPDPPPPQP